MPITVTFLLPGEGNINAVAMRFRNPKSGDIAFDSDDRMPLYYAYVVQFVSQAGSRLYFKLIQANGDGNPIEALFDVDLAEMNHVWRSLPSTLAPDPNDDQADTSLLFLTDAYILSQTDEKQRMLDAARPATKGPCTKWPCYKGARFLEQKVLNLEEENKRLRAEREKLSESYATLREKWNLLGRDLMERFRNVVPEES